MGESLLGRFTWMRRPELADLMLLATVFAKRWVR